MKTLKILSFIFSFCLLLLSSCSEEDTPEPKFSSVTLEFDAQSGSGDLVMGNTYTNHSGETFTVTKLQYYVSNIKLTADDGSVFTDPVSSNSGYYLVKEDGSINLANVPENDYVSVEFTVGVDSLRNTMAPAEREGDLDVGDLETGGDMYWGWNSGYICLKFEGVAAAVPDSTLGLWVQDSLGNYFFDTTQYTYWSDIFNIHVGGFGGYDAATVNNIRNVNLSFGSTKLMIREGATPEVHLTADVMKIMDGSTYHSFSDFYQEHSPERTGTVADNYKNMFAVDHIHND